MSTMRVWATRKVNEAAERAGRDRAMKIIGAKDEAARIRRELERWLIGGIDPRDAGLVNGRRIVDEINRICLPDSEPLP